MKPIKTLALVAFAIVICLANLGAVEIVTEDFESGVLPDGWTQEYQTGTYDWSVGTGSPTGFPAAAQSGTYNAIMHNANPGVTRLVLPAMDMEEYQGGMTVLEFYRAQFEKGDLADTLRVYTKADADSEWELQKEFADPTDAWTKESIRLKGVTDTYQIAFEATASNKNGVLLDNISLGAETPVKDTVWVGNTAEADYATLGELFTDINIRDLEGDVTAFIVSDIEETAKITLNEFDNGTLTIKAFGEDRTISGAVDNDALIALLGADNVNFTGSLVTNNPDYVEPTGDEDEEPSDEPMYLETTDGNHLTFDNTSAVNGTTFLLTDLEGNGSENVMFTNINIDGATDGTSSDASNGIAIWGADLTAAAGSSGHSNVTVENTNFSNAAVAFKAEAGAEDEMISGISLTNNVFSNAEGLFADAVIFTKYTDGLNISDNTFESFADKAIVVSYNNNETDTEDAKATIANNTFANAGAELGYVLDVDNSPKTEISSNTFTALTADRAIEADDIADAVVSDNIISGGTYEEVVYLDGANNIEFTGNTINDLNIDEKAVYIYEPNDGNFSNNKLQNITSIGTSTFGNSTYLIRFSTPSSEAIENLNFSNNIISGIVLNSATTSKYSKNTIVAVDFYYGADKLKFNGNAINNLSISRSTAHQNMEIFGVRFDEGADAVEMHHNTFSLDGTFEDQNSSSADNISAIIITKDDSNKWDVQNNIFSNSYFGVGGDSPAYILYAGSNVLTATALNHNAYDIEEASIAEGAIAKLDGNNIYTLADWQTLTGMEADGTANKVYFVDGLHLDKNSINDMALRAPKIKDIDTDLDGEERPDGQDTYIGADVVNATVALGDDLAIRDDKTIYCEDQDATFDFSLAGTFADGIERTITNGLTVTWEHEGAHIDPQNEDDNYLISNNGMRLTIEPIKPENAGVYRAMFQYQGAAEISTQELAIEVKQPVVITENLQNVITGCANDDVLTFGIEAAHALDYVWQKYDEEAGEYVDINLEDDEVFTSDFTIDLNKVEHTEAEGKYRVKAIGDQLCSTHHPVEVASDPIEVVVYDKITGVKTTAEFDMDNLCQGQTLNFAASIEDGDLVGYKWQKNVVGNWVDIDASVNPTAETSNLVLENISFDDNGRYRCVAIGYGDCQTLTNSDNDIKIEVPDAFAIAQNPAAQVVCKGEEASFVVAGNSVGEVISYQWMKDGMPISVEQNEFADDAILYVNDADYINIGEYTCVITAEDCNGVSEFTSESAILYVLRETEITRQPTTVTAAAGDDVMFAVEAHMKGIVPPYYQHDFQWYKRGVALEDNGRIQGAKSSVLTINDVEAADFENYYCVVTGQCGVATSKTASISEDYTIEIAAQPQAVAACQGEQAQFTVDANPSDASMTVEYEWYFNGNKLTDGTDYQGTTTETLTVSAAAIALEGKYSVKCVSDFAGRTFEVMSDEAELDVQTAPEVALVSDALIDFEEESELNLEVSANSESAVTYQWAKDGTDIAGATDAVFLKADVEMADAGTYTCTVTNDCGEVTSDDIVVNVIKKTDTGIEENTVAGLRIKDVTPNPVQNVATISIENRMTSNVKVYVTDAAGRRVATLFEGMLEGTKDIVIDANASNLTSGVYMITMEANGATLTKSFVVAK